MEAIALILAGNARSSAAKFAAGSEAPTNGEIPRDRGRRDPLGGRRRDKSTRGAFDRGLSGVARHTTVEGLKHSSTASGKSPS
jgi:hypothetical protein